MLAFAMSFVSAGGKSDKESKLESSAKSAPSLTVVPSIWETVAEGQYVTVSGKIRRVGNDPLSFLVITDSADKDWYTDAAGSVLLHSYEQRPVCVRGTVELKEMTLANGKSLGVRRILTGISIVQ